MVIAMTAADDCTQKVSTPPSSRKMRVVLNELGSNEAKKSSTACCSPRCMSMPVWRNVPRPRNMNEIPNKKSPMKRRFL